MQKPMNTDELEKQIEGIMNKHAFEVKKGQAMNAYKESLVLSGLHRKFFFKAIASFIEEREKEKDEKYETYNKISEGTIRFLNNQLSALKSQTEENSSEPTSQGSVASKAEDRTER